MPHGERCTRPRTAVWPLFTAGIVCLASGVVLGLGSKYGLVRYWWVATKLALNILLTGLVLVALRPGLSGLSGLGRQLAAGHPVTASIGDMIYPPIVSPVALLIAIVLAVFKPWGRIYERSERSRPPRALEDTPDPDPDEDVEILAGDGAEGSDSGAPRP